MQMFTMDLYSNWNHLGVSIVDAMVEMLGSQLYYGFVQMFSLYLYCYCIKNVFLY